MLSHFSTNNWVYTHTSMQNPDPLKSILQKTEQWLVPNGEHYIDPTDAWARARYRQEASPAKYYPEGLTSEAFALQFAKKLQNVFWSDYIDLISLCSWGAVKERKMSKFLHIQDALVTDISPFLIRKACHNLTKTWIQPTWVIINFESPETFLHLKELYTHLDNPGNKSRLYTLLWLTLWNEANWIVAQNIHNIRSLLSEWDYFMFDYAVHDSSVSQQDLEKKYAGEENITGVVSLFTQLWLTHKIDFRAECSYLEDEEWCYAIRQRVLFTKDTTITYKWTTYVFRGDTYYTTRISQRFNKEHRQIESFVEDTWMHIVHQIDAPWRWAILATL